jgi:short-subunit dehydrogenase
VDEKPFGSSMTNKTIIITGSSSGVGRLLTHELSKENKVIAVARRVEKMQQEFAENSNVVVVGCDISTGEELQTMFTQIDREFPGVDVIINCAGIMKSGNVVENEISDYLYSIHVNALGPLAIVKHFIPGMVKQGYGRIINFTSGAPLNNFAGYSAYSASKAILNSWTVTLGYELEGSGVLINLMSPGPVRTEMAPNAPMEPEVCLPTVRYLLDEVTTSGGFYWLGYKVPLKPDLEGVDWLRGKGNNKLSKIL